MADIYLARVRTGLGAARLVVLKELLPQLADDEHFAEMLITEAKLAARLCHPNVVTVEDLGRYDGVLYIAMEYVEGLDLTELLKQCSRRQLVFPLRFALSTVGHVLRALHYAHRLHDEQGQPLSIIHRDVSPSNVLLSFDGQIKLCDFGIASAATADAVPTPTIEGKAGYMSPEHARGEALDCRADVFAAGILLWELISGRRMYKRRTAGQRLIDVAAQGKIPPLVLRGLPDEQRLHDIVRRALQVDREQRYRSAGEFLSDLENYCIATELWMSPMRFGTWLSEHFADEKLRRRRDRERALRALDFGPPLVIERIAEPSVEVAQSAPGPRPASFPEATEPQTDEPEIDDDVQTDRHSDVRIVRLGSGRSLASAELGPRDADPSATASVWVCSTRRSLTTDGWRHNRLLKKFALEAIVTATVAFFLMWLVAAVWW